MFRLDDRLARKPNRAKMTFDRPSDNSDTQNPVPRERRRSPCETEPEAEPKPGFVGSITVCPSAVRAGCEDGKSTVEP
jgi:hypothetical protein